MAVDVRRCGTDETTPDDRPGSYARRTAAITKGFALTAIITLALGIGPLVAKFQSRLTKILRFATLAPTHSSEISNLRSVQTSSPKVTVPFDDSIFSFCKNRQNSIFFDILGVLAALRFLLDVLLALFFLVEMCEQSDAPPSQVSRVCPIFVKFDKIPSFLAFLWGLAARGC